MTVRGEIRLRGVDAIRALLDARHVELANHLSACAETIGEFSLADLGGHVVVPPQDWESTVRQEVATS